MKKIVFTALILMSFVPVFAGVGNDGSFSYSYPVELPPSPNGLAPSLSLNYNSNSPNGIAGMGWSIGGISKIVEDYSLGYNPGSITKAYSSPWGRLVQKNGSTTEFEPAINPDGVSAQYYDGSVVIGRPSSTLPAKSFSVTTKDGMKYHFEEIEYDENLQNDIFHTALRPQWLLSSVGDRYGRNYFISYDSNEYGIFPDIIEYACGNKRVFVKFNYEDRKTEDWVDRNSNGREVYRKRISTIEIKRNDKLLKEYTFNYVYDSMTSLRPKSLLTSVEKKAYDADGTYADSETISFNYSECESNAFGVYETSDYNDPTEYICHEYPNSFENHDVLTADINGDGLQDFISYEYWGGHETRFRTFINQGNGGYSMVYSQMYKGHDDNLPNISDTHYHKPFTPVTGDFNGDGLDDIVFVRHVYSYETGPIYDRSEKKHKLAIALFCQFPH